MISENKGLDMVWKLHAAVEVLEEQEKVMRKLHQQNNELTEENAKLHLEIKKLRNERKD
jgi:cell division protein FtsB